MEILQHKLFILETKLFVLIVIFTARIVMKLNMNRQLQYNAELKYTFQQ